MQNESGLLLAWRRDLQISQTTAARLLRCSQGLIGFVESGKRSIGTWRLEWMQSARAAFASGGIEKVEEMAAPVKPSAGRRAAVPAEDADEMTGWRIVMDMTQEAAARQLGLSVHTVRAIEHGRLRISPRVRAFMEKDERAKTGRT
jgi:DNA-binding XRE family transcriptional regulator